MGEKISKKFMDNPKGEEISKEGYFDRGVRQPLHIQHSTTFAAPFLRKYQIGLADAEIFSTEMEKSYKAFKAKPSEKSRAESSSHGVSTNYKFSTNVSIINSIELSMLITIDLI